MSTRRGFLSMAAAAGALSAFREDGLARVFAASRAAASRTPEETAQDEDYWREIQQAVTVNRAYINLNNGGV